MAVHLRGYEEHVRDAVAHYWKTLRLQAEKQKARKQQGGASDRGRRSDVTGAKQMDGFCGLLRWFLEANGMPDASIYTKRGYLEIPGYFRATKQWDLLVVHEGHLVAACEFKSQRGPSFGNNLNNRTEEALGNADDVWTAYREGAFSRNHQPPWLGWVMLLEDCEKSNHPVSVNEPHCKVFPEFRDASYAERWVIMLRKLVLEKKYNASAFLMSDEVGGIKGAYTEPEASLNMKSFLASLGGHVAGYLATM